MILCNLDYLFDPDEIAYTVTDVDRPVAVCTRSNSRVCFHDGNKKYVLSFKNIYDVIEVASRNPHITFLVELGFPIYTWLEDFGAVQKLCNTIQEYNNIHLLFVNGWDLYNDTLYTDLNKEIHQGVYEYSRCLTINHNRIHFYVCNIAVIEKIKSYFSRSSVLYYNIYFNRILERRQQTGFEKYIPCNTQRKKHFLCLNNYNKAHRTDIVSYIKNNHSDKFIYSYLKPDDENIHLKNILDVEHNMSTITDWQDSISPEYIDSTYLYIATETFGINKFTVYNYSGPDESVYQHHDGWISEKTLKSAYNMQPVMILGPAGSLATFKSLGFKTFPEIFNETYDSITDYDNRFKAVKDNIDRLTSMSIEEIHQLYHSKSVQEKLMHNRELFEDYANNDPFKQFYTK